MTDWNCVEFDLSMDRVDYEAFHPVEFSDDEYV